VIDDAQLKHADDEYYRDVEVTSDPYVGMEMAMSRGAEGEVVHATGPETRQNDDGMPVGVTHNNPLLDSRSPKYSTLMDMWKS
jgi:hypothetical protein